LTNDAKCGTASRRIPLIFSTTVYDFAAVERFMEARVDTDEIVNVPEYLRQEILTALLGMISDV